MKYIVSFAITFFVFKSFSFDKSIIPKKAKSLSLVKIHDFDESGYEVIGSATGFFISKTRVITNYHVIEKALLLRAESGFEGLGHITVAPYEGPKDLVYKDVKVGFISVEDDMAILEVLDETASLGPQVAINLFKEKSKLDELSNKSIMFSLGHPFYELLQATGQKLVYKTDSVFEDYMTVWSRFGNYPGFSGSPLFDENGDLIALMHSYSYLKGEARNTCSKNGTLGYGTKVSKLIKNLEYYENELLSNKDHITVIKPFKEEMFNKFDSNLRSKAMLNK